MRFGLYPQELNSIFTGQVRHMSEQYSRIERSEENLPIRATFRIDMRFHRWRSRYAALTCPGNRRKSEIGQQHVLVPVE